MSLTINSLCNSNGNGQTKRIVKKPKNAIIKVEKEMFGFLSLNGAAKDTLMKTIATLQNANSFTIPNEMYISEKICAILRRKIYQYERVTNL